jgi:hypothetical protein
MALTQMQIIQSLGEAMTWFERELSWGVAPTALRHLSGRLGELYAALITNGQMATDVNQQGYDVVGGNGERISVKTTAMMGQSGHISFNPHTLDKVDRVIILRINTEEMQIEILLNEKVSVVRPMLSKPDSQGKVAFSLSKLLSERRAVDDIPVIREAVWKSYILKELESGTILIEKDGKSISPVLPKLREIAQDLKVNLVNSNGNAMNTRQSGSILIRMIRETKGGA